MMRDLKDTTEKVGLKVNLGETKFITNLVLNNVIMISEKDHTINIRSVQ